MRREVEASKYGGIEIFDWPEVDTKSDEDLVQHRSDEQEVAPASGGSSPIAVGRFSRARRWPLKSRQLRSAAVLLVLLTCGAIAILGALHSQDASLLATRAAAAYTPPPPTIAEARATRYTIALIGDGAVRVDASDLAPEQTWPPLLAVGLDARIARTVEDGAGYTVAGSDGRTFVDAAAQIPRGVDMVVFVGGDADAAATPMEIATAATRAFSLAARRAPGADVVAVGPLFVGTREDPARVRAVRVALRTAAGIGEVRWIDPVAERWLTGVTGFSALNEAEHYSIFERLQVQLGPELSMRRTRA